MNKRGLVVALVVGILAVLAGYGIRQFMITDSCMDGGGCWDATDGVCRVDEINAQELCNRGR